MKVFDSFSGGRGRCDAGNRRGSAGRVIVRRRNQAAHVRAGGRWERVATEEPLAALIVGPFLDDWGVDRRARSNCALVVVSPLVRRPSAERCGGPSLRSSGERWRSELNTVQLAEISPRKGLGDRPPEKAKGNPGRLAANAQSQTGKRPGFRKPGNVGKTLSYALSGLAVIGSVRTVPPDGFTVGYYPSPPLGAGC
jgi:hypothetical protein